MRRNGCRGWGQSLHVAGSDVVCRRGVAIGLRDRRIRCRASIKPSLQTVDLFKQCLLLLLHLAKQFPNCSVLRSHSLDLVFQIVSRGLISRDAVLIDTSWIRRLSSVRGESCDWPYAGVEASIIVVAASAAAKRAEYIACQHVSRLLRRCGLVTGVDIDAVLAASSSLATTPQC